MKKIASAHSAQAPLVVAHALSPPAVRPGSLRRSVRCRPSPRGGVRARAAILWWRPRRVVVGEAAPRPLRGRSSPGPMSSFSESALEKKLSELSNSQQSVQTLSLWLIHHRKHAGPIVAVWHRELRKGARGVCPAEAALAAPARGTGAARGAAGERGRFVLAALRGTAPGEVGALGVCGSLGAVYLLLLLFTKLRGDSTCEGCIPVIAAAFLGRQWMEAQPSVGCEGEDAQLLAGGLDVKKESTNYVPLEVL